MPDITIPLTAQQVTRIQNVMDLQSEAEVRSWLINVLVENVRYREAQIAREAVSNPTPMVIT